MKFFKAIRLNILTSRIRLIMTGCRNNRSLAIAGVLVSRILISVCLVSGLLQSNRVLANDIPQSCQRSFNYSIYLSGLHTGEMSRTENWQGKSAVIISKSEASILGIGTQYQQRTELSWSNNSNEWLTDSFHQQVTGFRSRDMQATFYNNGLESRVDIDGDIENYTSSQIPLRDVDTLAIQIRENLLGGRRQFALIRQASDAIEPYQFYVKDKLITTIGSWGEIQLIPVEQTGAEEVTYYFAPSMNYQLVKAHYHGMILQGVIELDRYVSSCDTMSES
ncbi:hypothetical protein [Shewanella frigidimarina]|uniref:DUF3108 domain-containing protein n=1 Tax=Shewanella frigidimarina (strain NCIMB 400) TaxID=318167 RepID=Q081T2_SHEFN|nr:conserved hypothetical protein [Shewanella frigidimarina NCIMB 400]